MLVANNHHRSSLAVAHSTITGQQNTQFFLHLAVQMPHVLANTAPVTPHAATLYICLHKNSNNNHHWQCASFL